MLISQNDFPALKTVLYDTNINVLDRSAGYSLLDYAMSKHNKRAAIILADYNNSSIPERNIVKIKNTISYLESEITKNTKTFATTSSSQKNKAESNIAQLKALKNSLTNQIKELQTKVGNVNNDDRITKLEKEVKFLMGNFISITDDKANAEEKMQATKSLKITAKSKDC